MTNRVGVALLVLATFQLGSAATTPETTDGYSPKHAAVEREWESRFRNLPDPNTMRDSMQRLSAHPHHVGSPYDKENAEWILAQYKQWGWDAHIEEFQVLFPTPKLRLRRRTNPNAGSSRGVAAPGGRTSLRRPAHARPRRIVIFSAALPAKIFPRYLSRTDKKPKSLA